MLPRRRVRSDRLVSAARAAVRVESSCWEVGALLRGVHARMHADGRGSRRFGDFYVFEGVPAGAVFDELLVAAKEFFILDAVGTVALFEVLANVVGKAGPPSAGPGSIISSSGAGGSVPTMVACWVRWMNPVTKPRKAASGSWGGGSFRFLRQACHRRQSSRGSWSGASFCTARQVSWLNSLSGSGSGMASPGRGRSERGLGLRGIR